MTDRIRKAAQAVLDRWDTPLWKDAPATSSFMEELRAALAEPADPHEMVRQLPVESPTGIRDLRRAMWLDPQCADRGACQSLIFKGQAGEPAAACAQPENPAPFVLTSHDLALLGNTNRVTVGAIRAVEGAVLRKLGPREPVPALPGWKFERLPTGEFIINCPTGGSVVRQVGSGGRTIPEEILWSLADAIDTATPVKA